MQQGSILASWNIRLPANTRAATVPSSHHHAPIAVCSPSSRAVTYDRGKERKLSSQHLWQRASRSLTLPRYGRRTLWSSIGLRQAELHHRTKDKDVSVDDRVVVMICVFHGYALSVTGMPEKEGRTMHIVSPVPQGH